MQIEIAESTSTPRFFNHRDGHWEHQEIHFATSTRIHLYGVDVAITPKDELLLYKAKLDRDVDHLDRELISAVSTESSEASTEVASEAPA